MPAAEAEAHRRADEVAHRPPDRPVPALALEAAVLPAEAAVGTPVGEWTDMVDVRALQPGVELSSRFSPGLQPCHRSNSIRDQENLESLNRLESVYDSGLESRDGCLCRGGGGAVGAVGARGRGAAEARGHGASGWPRGAAVAPGLPRRERSTKLWLVLHINAG